MCKELGEISDTPILEIQNAVYTYDGEGLPVWKDLSCQFHRGKIHAVSGPSGCGKSSVLYLLNGMIPHMIEGKLEGRVLLEGQDITEQKPRNRCDKIGLVMQSPESQFCTFTVEEELAFGMESLCLEPEEMQKRIRRTLEYVGMSGYEKMDLNWLSGGQKQKAAIASILVMEPEILLLDEPTANLDPASRTEIFQLIARLSKEAGKTIILVEHNLEEMMEHVDYLLVLDQNGRVLSDEPVKDAKSLVTHNRRTEACGKRQPDAVPNSKEAILETSRLRFAYPQSKREDPAGKLILDGLDFVVNRQDFLAIVGENGVGKSTLIRLIFQIYSQDEGTVSLYGKPIEQYKKKELYKQIGLVFQNPEEQFITNRVQDEMMFSLKKTKLSHQEKEERVQEMLKRFHLEKDRDKSPFVLSQGQKRRLSVATMLLTEQKILFLDEPTYGQDFENRHELMKDMQKLNENGITIVMITHDLSLVKEYAGRVVRIEKGKNAFDGTTEEYFRQIEKEKLTGHGHRLPVSADKGR